MDQNNLKRLTFEEGYDRLDRVIYQLEAGDITLQESVTLYEEGVQLAKYCGNKLDNAELRVSELLNGAAEKDSDDLLF